MAQQAINAAYIEAESAEMLDADHLFLRKPDELFQCGQFCAIFINTCISHTDLFVLQPSMEVFKDMLHQLEIGKENPDDLRLCWNVLCGPDSVITFPGAPWLKPWYWWSWPVLLLGIQWHEHRQNLGRSDLRGCVQFQEKKCRRTQLITLSELPTVPQLNGRDRRCVVGVVFMLHPLSTYQMLQIATNNPVMASICLILFFY